MSDTLIEEQDAHDPWLQPYAEHRILAGFLREEDVRKVHPAAGSWPEEVVARVRSLHGTAWGLAPRPEAGQCCLSPVEEPEALAVLRMASQAVPIGADMPVSYSWVEISNLIATTSVADSLPQEVAVFNSHPQSLAEYSLIGPPPTYTAGPNGSLYFSSVIGLQPLNRVIEGDQLILRYQLAQTVQPIVVGYEQGRFYLLNAYGRVLQALAGRVDKLLCLVHYGLDFTAPQMGVRLFNPKGGAINHFGPALLAGGSPPMVKDFLDPSLSVVFPARSPFFIVMPTIQAHQVQFKPPPSAQLPLEIIDVMES
jgi:hypothetical protein